MPDTFRDAEDRHTFRDAQGQIFDLRSDQFTPYDLGPGPGYLTPFDQHVGRYTDHIVLALTKGPHSDWYFKNFARPLDPPPWFEWCGISGAKELCDSQRKKYPDPLAAQLEAFQRAERLKREQPFKDAIALKVEQEIEAQGHPEESRVHLSPAEWRIFKTVAKSKVRLTTTQIRERMREDGFKRAESTVRIALGKLTREGLLDNRQDCVPAGYFITDKGKRMLKGRI
jgi:hypothetical protein